ncbi:MAG: hypothetical protein HFJ20_02025 [Clostridia bacterium]|nr:hypothetical protein [Clostridia bacterium]
MDNYFILNNYPNIQSAKNYLLISYTIINDRKEKNYSNKEIDISKTYLNYYLKKSELYKGNSID